MTDYFSFRPCAGSQVVYEPNGAHRACPSKPQVVALVGDTGTDDGGGPDSAVVSGLLASMYRQGVSLQTFTIRARRRNDEWRIVSVERGMVIE